MHPILLRIPFFGGTSITIYTYGFMIALAFLLGMFWVGRESKRLGVDPAKSMDLVFYIIVFSILGSRLFHLVVSERERFLSNPLTLFKIWEGGLGFYGGLIAGILVSIYYVRRKNLSFLLISDIFSPAISFGHAIGRIGCFMAGCCYGRVAPQAWYSIVFPNNANSFAPTGVSLYPTQLMEAMGELTIFSILFILRKYKRFDGQILATYLMLYAILRAVVEYFRGDVTRGFVIEPWLSTSQFISIFIFGVGIIIYFLKWKKHEA